jgi:N-acyl amino acid synthase of PEP-CTERM/exosortase system
MSINVRSTVIQQLREAFIVERADTPELVREAHRLRHQVYCVERGYEAGDHGLEIDAFDARAHHAVMRHRASGEVMGTVRLVLASDSGADECFPMQSVCDVSLPHHLPIATTAEISRFAISKRQRDLTGVSSAIMRLGLMQGIVLLSGELGVTHWCAMMEPSLLRLLQASAIHFRPVGSLVDFHGLRQPSIGGVDEILGRMAQEAADVWEFITDGGQLWKRDIAQRIAA